MTHTDQSTTAHTDMQLMERTAAGDRAAFAELMSRHQDMVFAVALRIMRNRQAALDATQDTFLTLLRKADRYSGRAAVTTWLYRVTVNTCYDQLRKAKRRAFDSLPDHIDPADSHAQNPFTSVDLGGPVADALRQLPEEFKTAVILSDIDGLALAEVAEILDVPVGTVKSRVFRGRKLLAQQLGNLMEGSGRSNRDRHVSSRPARPTPGARIAVQAASSSMTLAGRSLGTTR